MPKDIPRIKKKHGVHDPRVGQPKARGGWRRLSLEEPDLVYQVDCGRSIGMSEVNIAMHLLSFLGPSRTQAERRVLVHLLRRYLYLPPEYKG